MSHAVHRKQQNYFNCYLRQGLLNRWTSQLDFGCTTGGLERVVSVHNILNGCLDAYEVKVNMDIFKYQEKVKLISQFQRFFFHFSMAY